MQAHGSADADEGRMFVRVAGPAGGREIHGPAVLVRGHDAGSGLRVASTSLSESPRLSTSELGIDGVRKEGLGPPSREL